MLGLNSLVRPLLLAMKDCDMARLIYRDHVTVKHASRKRLSDEVTSKLERAGQAVDQRRQLSILGSAEKFQTVDPMSKMLIKYLLEAWQGTCLTGQLHIHLQEEFLYPSFLGCLVAM